jgi:FkbM family methyltransferase
MRTPTGRRIFENAYLFYKIVLEAGPISRLKAYVPANSWAIDVGANIGIFTTRFAEWVKPDGRVIAIEPEFNNFSSLRRRLARAGADVRVIALQAVAAEKTGTLQLEINPDHPGDHKIGTIGVPTAALTLDTVWSDNRCPAVSLIKIDVQGAEMRVLRGAIDIIRQCRPALFIEVDEAALQRQRSSADEIVSFLGQFGYRPYRLQRSGPPQSVSPHGLGSRRYEDVLFLAKD